MSNFNLNLDVTTGQGSLLEPEGFQASLIKGMTSALLRQNHPPCLLRAPTGSGKTFMLARVLADVSAERGVVWLWFVPFVTLVAQTQDAIKSNAADLTPLLLSYGRNQECAAGQVLISTVQAVAKAQWRSKGYNADGDDDTRTLAEWVRRARAQGLAIGMVVDEAHIALDKATEFGRFAQWLQPDYMLMATATPKDQRLLDFLVSAGKAEFESFAVSRDDVVEARLNKKYIEAVIYDLGQNLQTIADLKRTVLRQAWARNQQLQQELSVQGISLTPLLLVQVANGEGTVEEAEQILISLCKVPPQSIGKHSADAPDPVMMAAIAHDTSKQVLIFKQSAGTGFDAPRAFVLASTKCVNDPDFAMQFIGRVMRVAQPIRYAFARPRPIDPQLNTAYVYLADAQAQSGFQQAVYVASQVKNQLEGQTEKMQLRTMVSGATVITNRSSNQYPLSYDMGLPVTESGTPSAESGADYDVDTPVYKPQHDLFSGQDLAVLDVIAPSPKSVPAKPPLSLAELEARLESHSVRSYPLKHSARNLPCALKRERRPEMLAMTRLSEQVARGLVIPAKLVDDAIKVAQNSLLDIERHTDLTTGASHDEKVLIVTDRSALAKEAKQALSALPQVEEEDIKTILKVLAQRLLPVLQASFTDANTAPNEASLRRMVRDAANWIAKLQADRLGEAMHEAIALQAETIDAGPLPNAMLFASDIALTQARKNIYGVFPPSKDELAQVEQQLLLDDRVWLKERTWDLDGHSYLTGQFDTTSSLNSEELAFAKALDRSDFVTWWHRNPDRKSYSVQLVRGEHRNFFYPDFIVCLEHELGDEPMIRLIETKENVKDAARKAKHVPQFYGKVLFLTKDQARLRWVKEDGSLGDDVDLSDLAEMRQWLSASKPAGVLTLEH